MNDSFIHSFRSTPILHSKKPSTWNGTIRSTCARANESCLPATLLSEVHSFRINIENEIAAFLRAQEQKVLTGDAEKDIEALKSVIQKEVCG